MGFQYRKRTKGKNGWFNISYSDKNGLGMSTSVKVGNVTHNFGGKRANRTTVDIGNGLKYVSYGPSKAKKRQPTKSQSTVYTSSEPLKWSDFAWLLRIIFAVVVVFNVSDESWLWKIVGIIICIFWLAFEIDDVGSKSVDKKEDQLVEETNGYDPRIEEVYQHYRDCDTEEYNTFVQALRDSHAEESVEDFIRKVNRRI